MSMGFRADPTNTSGVITVAGADQVVITNASNVVATTFTGALAGNAATATKLSTATGVAPSYGARAWVSFNGRNNTSNVFDLSNTNRFIFGNGLASGNVSSVLRNGAGDYTINFALAMPDINFCVVGNAESGAALNVVKTFQDATGGYVSPTLTTARIVTGNATTNQDPSTVSVIVMR